MTLMEALMKLDLIIDESDPDVSGLVRYLGGWGGGEHLGVNFQSDNFNGIST